MILGRVVGTVVATKKDPRLEGHKLLIIKPVTPDGKDEAGYVIAVDTVGAGFRPSDHLISLCRLHPSTSLRIISLNPFQCLLSARELTAELLIFDPLQDLRENRARHKPERD